MPKDLAKVVRAMWDPDDSAQTRFSEVIENSNPSR